MRSDLPVHHGRQMRMGPPFDSASTSVEPRVTFTRPYAASCAATRRKVGICARQMRSSDDSAHATSEGQIDAEGARESRSAKIVSAMAWSSCKLVSGSRRSVRRVDHEMPDREHIAAWTNPSILRTFVVSLWSEA